MRKFMKKSMALMLAMALTAGQFGTDFPVNEIKADTANSETSLGSLSDKVTGTWSYWDGSKDVVQTNAMLLDKLPTLANKGTYRWTTDNYDSSTGALDIGGFATSMAWNYSSNAFGNSVYAIPMSYVANAKGMFVTKPTTVIVEDTNTSTLFMNQPENGDLSDFIIGTNYTFASSKVDKVTEWSTDVIMENTNDPEQYMKTIMTQGSPFSFFEVNGGTTMTVKRNRRLPSDIVAYNGSGISDSTMLVIRVYDNQDLVSGYGDYDYYALYVPKGTTWTQASATASYADNHMGDLTASFASEDKAYMTLAYLCETSGQNDSLAKSIAAEYEKYAYNFITDTETSFIYDRDNGTITTTYRYAFDKKAESTADGTVMGILPHQYKNMSGYTYLDNTARTIRGTMKYLTGSSYSTVLTYSGILPAMPSVDDSDKAQLQAYVDEFMEKYGPTDTQLTKESYDVNTYDTGKKLNRALQAMEAAEACGDTETASTLLQAIERELADWYTSDGTEEDRYFYYDEGVGSLFGFPQAYYTVDGMTDHHFHYGYFIQASAQVALRDPSFIQKYGNIVEELIADYATYEKNNANSKYPFLRYFSTYEGHSWASGHANFADGNNQESSSEAINAWAALILWGQATQNQDLTDLGIYLYQTEISSVNCYWFDVDGDVLDAKFKKTASADSSLPKYAYASMVWGGKYTYAAWWTAEPLQVQGINILPMTSASFYYAKNKDFILTNWKTVNLKEAEYTGDDKETKRWNELWSAYLAIADPEQALQAFDDQCAPEAGDSKAHAYHYIMALDKAGTPDLSVTSNNPLSSAFVDEDGNMTYVVYNASSEEKTVTFSDGTELAAQPGTMTTVTDGEVAGKAQYTIEHYLQNADGTYSLFQTETKSARIENTVTAAAKTYTGYELNTSVQGTVESGIVVEDGSLVLKLYYDIAEIRPTEPSEDPSLYTKLGNYNGYDVSYYIKKDDFGIANIQLLDGNRTFYVVYSGDYNSSNTKGYLNKSETSGSILTGVYNLNLDTLTPDTYNTLRIESGDKIVYMIIKYGNPTTPPDTSDFEEETTTPDPAVPTDASGLVVGNPADNTIAVTFRETQEQNIKGQVYNIYVDNQIKLSNVAAGTYMIDKVEAGNHTVKVTAVLGNRESEGVTADIKVKGEAATTEKTTATETTTIEKSTPTICPTPPYVSDNPTALETTESDTKASTVTTTAPAAKITAPAKAKIKKITAKKRSAKKVKIKIKKVAGANGYQVAIYKTKKNAKKNKKAVVKKIVTKRKVTIKSKKLRNKKKLFVRVRAYKLDANGKKVYGKWSKRKKVKIK